MGHGISVLMATTAILRPGWQMLSRLRERFANDLCRQAGTF